MRWTGHVARMVEVRNSYKILVGKPKTKLLYGRPTGTCEDMIKMEVKEMYSSG